ncbi:diaminopimelate epimerase [Butyricicoccus faecihominis]|uniref:diaminopimelate epimerase n=1 Tax=Butyricicoccaceae TaxID=3085642 RepID=UPI002479E21C|nr:diaminopimelate epimerase [Agathobaculum sp. NTUH-O15-33]MCQ5129030.1 diaminopimelate epimerase [Butyricicoccus faecihominis]WNX83568.1 diaminopimelate epimerase [Agathobaculum sp. NTUH-O15-33]
MKLAFTKMHGCGNNYIYFNCFDQTVPDPEALSVRLSEPHFGIGGDGVILISPSDKADAQMRIFNADGSEGKMCGNGIRCVGKYLYDNGMVNGRTTVTVDTLSGVKTLRLATENGKAVTARVDMGAAILQPDLIPVALDGDRVIDAPLVVDEKVYHITCVSMGNPHCVIFSEEDIDSLDLTRIGPKFEHHPLFPERVNTEFVNVLKDGTLKMRVWERGSGETWACGTGACAVGVAACLGGHAQKDSDITVHLRGGDLLIRYTDETVFMTGAATTVFKGEIEL